MVSNQAQNTSIHAIIHQTNLTILTHIHVNGFGMIS